ncbi:hypothetical protein [Hansschlegelia zhihuaiae]|uniref:Uncharacterized protein n=1 Tax=Hansschlegelia zhihuaiae TaxID=405005 RepID=A0A4Q0M4N3_9HYPH|nr:hypothetical protein [Hansschlegelia zhihuaiae]RXF67930.1 hypothetical protein EK403_20600 [Hansschlegelia zhihuaiae]
MSKHAWPEKVVIHARSNPNRSSGRLAMRSQRLAEAGVGEARKRGLARLLLRWPSKRAELQRLAQNDPVTADLCEAYELACAAIDYWQRVAGGAAADRVIEYGSLATLVEEDILSRLH